MTIDAALRARLATDAVLSDWLDEQRVSFHRLAAPKGGKNSPADAILKDDQLPLLIIRGDASRPVLRTNSASIREETFELRTVVLTESDAETQRARLETLLDGAHWSEGGVHIVASFLTTERLFESGPDRWTLAQTLSLRWHR